MSRARGFVHLAVVFTLAAGFAACLTLDRGTPHPSADAAADHAGAADLLAEDAAAIDVVDAGRAWPELNAKVDLLFVVDSSASMNEEQAGLALGFPVMVDALRHPAHGSDGSGNPCTSSDQSGCRIPDLQIGVVSADLGAGDHELPMCSPSGDEGKLQTIAQVSGCTPPTEPFIRYANGTTNVPGSGDAIERVKSAFGCIAQLGDDGCGFEQQLEAARRAVDPALDINPGFVRPDAHLVVVFITDEDDCSAQDVSFYDPTDSSVDSVLGPLFFRCFEFGVTCDTGGRDPGPRQSCSPSSEYLHDVQSRYVEFFRQLKPPGGVIVAVIAGPSSPVVVGEENNSPRILPSCTSASGSAFPAIRVRSFGDAFAPDSFFTTICQADFRPALTTLGEMIAAKLAR